MTRDVTEETPAEELLREINELRDKLTRQRETILTVIRNRLSSCRCLYCGGGRLVMAEDEDEDLCGWPITCLDCGLILAVTPESVIGDQG